MHILSTIGHFIEDHPILIDALLKVIELELPAGSAPGWGPRRASFQHSYTWLGWASEEGGSIPRPMMSDPQTRIVAKATMTLGPAGDGT